MGLRDKLSRNKESEMDKWSDEGTVDWLSTTPPPPAFKLKLKSKPQSIARQPKPPLHGQDLQRARQQQLRLRHERLRQSGMSNASSGSQHPRSGQAKQAPGQPLNTISINISMPKFQLPKVDIPWPLVRRWGIRVGVGLVVLVGMVMAMRLYLGGVGTDKPEASKATSEESETPSYQPLAPKGKQNLASGDAAVSTYDSKRKLYSYNDNYEGVQLTVSQQPLPSSFKSDPIQIRKAADSIRATDEIDTALGMAYIGFDEKANVQRVMLVYRDLLVFIMTNKKLDNETIKSYIETLR